MKEKFGIDPINCTEEEADRRLLKGRGFQAGEEANKARAIDLLWKQVRKTIDGPAFLIGVPIFLEPLAKRSPENPNVVERFQVILAGSEMGKGFSELNDPIDQRARFEYQQELRDAGDDEAQRLDERLYPRDGIRHAAGISASASRSGFFIPRRQAHPRRPALLALAAERMR